MARRGLRFKPTRREVLLGNSRALAFMAMAAPIEKAAEAEAFVQTVIAAIPAAPKKRIPGPGVNIDSIHGTKRAPMQREAPVVSAISELLARHPKVLFACRQNTGMASYEAASGKYAPVRFYRVLTHSSNDMTITDFWGILRDGRVLAIEAKAPGFKEPRTDREFRQAAFLSMVRNAGGIALFATDAEQVARALA